MPSKQGRFPYYFRRIFLSCGAVSDAAVFGTVGPGSEGCGIVLKMPASSAAAFSSARPAHETAVLGANRYWRTMLFLVTAMVLTPSGASSRKKSSCLRRR
ncbi:MAG TPA: hypothetical protein VGI47_01305 [Candidatus Binataceae bacterium]